MCGIAGIFGSSWKSWQLDAMIASQHHRGPDGSGSYYDPAGLACLGHNRLRIIDLSESARQPMSDPEGRLWMIFNGEIYNYLELRRELQADWNFRTKSDTEVLLAAYSKYGEACLEKLIGMFSFLVWDQHEKRLFGARDRFGVKPFYYHRDCGGALLVASEIKALHAAGVPREPNERTWATYLRYGLYDHTKHTFWKDIFSVPPGHSISLQNDVFKISCWYDLSSRLSGGVDERAVDEVQDEYIEILKHSVRLRFRSDVPVGINLSGGLDSSTLLGFVQQIQGTGCSVKAFTFITGDPRYDELPWVQEMLSRTNHPSVACLLSPKEVPELAIQMQRQQDEPYGGLPTLAYARLFEQARLEGTIVLLDGQGMDEQWGGYDYYRSVLDGGKAGTVQGTNENPVRPACLTPEFSRLAEEFQAPEPFSDQLLNLQYRDIRHTKIPRALRFNDRISMMYSTELREPFLDHRLVELALRQPIERKLHQTTSKWMLRRICTSLLPQTVRRASKRALQTPQREWLRGFLKNWAGACIDSAIKRADGWLIGSSVSKQWEKFLAGSGDNSFFVWQWISLGMILAEKPLGRNSPELKSH